VTPSLGDKLSYAGNLVLSEELISYMINVELAIESFFERCSECIRTRVIPQESHYFIMPTRCRECEGKPVSRKLL
jgi:hypothetical protein